MSTTILDLVLDNVRHNPEKVAPLIEALRPLLPTGTAQPPRPHHADEAAARLRKSRRTLIRAANDGRVTGA